MIIPNSKQAESRKYWAGKKKERADICWFTLALVGIGWLVYLAAKMGG